MAKRDSNYERIEVTFAKDNEEEMKLYNHAIKNNKSKLLGKTKYIKQLILKDIEDSN